MIGWPENDDEPCVVSVRGGPGGGPDGGSGGGTVVVAGELDRDTDRQLRDAVRDALDRGWSPVAVDLTGVGFLSSGSVNLLIALQREAAGQGCRLHVAGASGMPARVLELARPHDLFAPGPAEPRSGSAGAGGGGLAEADPDGGAPGGGGAGGAGGAGSARTEQ